MPINEGNYGEDLYRITIGTEEFKVYAPNEEWAIDAVADHIEAEELEGLYSDWYGLFDLCEGNETPDKYAAANGLTCAGNHGIYIQVLGIEKQETISYADLLMEQQEQM